jgi:hypothetical protein
VTIWTLADQESTQAAITQDKIGSLLFKAIATSVISDDDIAKLELITIEDLITVAKDNTSLMPILQKIRNLFED